MKVIFLDVDGVLNHNNAREVVRGGIIGLNSACLEQLSRVVHSHDAKIVLVSTWKLFTGKTAEDSKLDGKYLITKLAEYGMSIYDKTDGPCGEGRGQGIIDYLNSHSDIESYIIIDDEMFKDYHCPEIKNRLVKTSFYEWGLTESLADKAIKMLEELV
jgi:hypothetical protein